MNRRRVFPEFIKQGSGNRCLCCDGKIRLNTPRDRIGLGKAYNANTWIGWVCRECLEEPPEEVG